MLAPLPCYLNGEYTLLPDAKISVMDRGFIFGDGIYEVVPVYGRCLFRFEQHMARLERSLAELRIPNPHTRSEWRAIAERLVADFARSTEEDPEKIEQMVYIQVTRGVAMRDHAMLPGLTPTVFVMTNAMKLPAESLRQNGVSCVTADDFRWEKAHIKSTSLLGAVFARQISVDAGAAETIMFRDDWLSEGAASNVWIVKNGLLLGPPRDNLVLEGIRYGLLEEICKMYDIPFELRGISRQEVLAADEVLLSSATKEVLPVTRIDDQPVGDGRPGPLYAQLYAGYQAAKLQARLRRSP
ncbi:MAG: D-amino acid aminotransferase [Hylemonella sp.]|nr:D-amino acid aminotransferase [Hylemonella sp.]